MTYSVIDSFIRIAVLQIQRINDHGLRELEAVTHPVTQMRR